eukprot:UN28061
MGSQNRWDWHKKKTNSLKHCQNSDFFFGELRGEKKRVRKRDSYKISCDAQTKSNTSMRPFFTYNLQTAFSEARFPLQKQIL